MTARKPKPTPADVGHDRSIPGKRRSDGRVYVRRYSDGTIAEHDAEAVGDLGETDTPAVVPDLATEIDELVDPVGTLEQTVDELATNATKVGPLLLELTCDPEETLGYFELTDGTVAARVYIDAGADPLELEPFLAALGAPFTSCGRTVAASVPAELADAWGRRYARAARIGD